MFTNKYGNNFIITSFINNRYTCKTLCGKYQTTCSVNSITNKTLRHPLDITVQGVGYLGFGEYNRNYKSYGVWGDIISRCYNLKYHTSKYYGQKGVTMAKEWYDFQVFSKWYYENSCKIDDEEIDKDLIGGNCYSPENCVMLPKKVNRFLSMFFKKDFKGVYYNNDGKKRANPWKVILKGKHIGTFNNKVEAQEFLTVKRREAALLFLENYKTILSEKVYNTIKQKVETYEPFI